MSMSILLCWGLDWGEANLQKEVDRLHSSCFCDRGGATLL